MESTPVRHIVFRSNFDLWLAIVALGTPVVALSAASLAAARGGRFDLQALGGIGGVLVVADRLDFLRIRAGRFRWPAPVGSIASVSATRDPLASPAPPI